MIKSYNLDNPNVLLFCYIDNVCLWKPHGPTVSLIIYYLNSNNNEWVPNVTEYVNLKFYLKYSHILTVVNIKLLTILLKFSVYS